MERPLRNIAFIVEDLLPDTPAQHLLDRFLRGYPHNGEFHRLDNCQVHVWLPPTASDAEVQRRIKDFGLRCHDSIESAVAQADGTIVVPRRISSPKLLKSTIQSAPPGSVIFVHGALADSLDEARDLCALAAPRGITISAGTSIATTWRLPDIDLPDRSHIKEAVIVVQGESPLAELHALDGLLPVLERREGGERGVLHVEYLAGEAVRTRTGAPASASGPAAQPAKPTVSGSSDWSRLIAAALSRSDTSQGDPVRDGRTQNLLGLGLVPKLARNPRGFVLEHADGVRSTLLVLDGVIADFNFALQLDDGSIISAQLHRAPPPQRQEYSRLAGVIEEYIRSHKSPSPLSRALLSSGLLQTFAKLRSAPGHVATPQLDVSQFSK